MINFNKLQELHDLCIKEGYKDHINVTGFIIDLIATFDPKKNGKAFKLKTKKMLSKTLSSKARRKYLQTLENKRWIECTHKTGRIDFDEYKILWENIEKEKDLNIN